MAERTTITLESDVAERLRQEVHASGRSFKDVVNDAIRAGLARERRATDAFVVQSRPMGLRRGLSLDDIDGLLDQVDGVQRRW